MWTLTNKSITVLGRILIHNFVEFLSNCFEFFILVPMVFAFRVSLLVWNSEKKTSPQVSNIYRTNIKRLTKFPKSRERILKYYVFKLMIITNCSVGIKCHEIAVTWIINKYSIYYVQTCAYLNYLKSSGDKTILSTGKGLGGHEKSMSLRKSGFLTPLPPPSDLPLTRHFFF